MNSYPATLVIPLRQQVDEWLEQSVDSCLRQTVAAEVLVVTASDTPESNLAVLARLQQQSDGRMRTVRRPRAGFAAALNHAFGAACSDRVGLLFSDDWLDPDALELCLAVDADIVSGSKRIWSDDGTNPLHVVWDRAGSAAQLKQRETVEAQARYITHLLLFRRQAVLDAGGVDETLGDCSGVDDYDLIWTLLERGASVGFTDRAVYNVRDHYGDRLTLRPQEEQLASLVKILTKHGLDEEERSALIPQHMRWFSRRLTDVLADDAAKAESRPAVNAG